MIRNLLSEFIFCDYRRLGEAHAAIAEPTAKETK